MTQASQALPSWLTLTSTVITNDDGSVSTSFDTLTLPLTYYGPPIPLGTDGTWVYGGLSSPAPTPTPSSTPPPSPTATPSSIPSATSTPVLSSVTSSPSSSAQPSTTSTTSSTTSISPLPSATSGFPTVGSHGLSKAAIGGLIGGILGFLLLLIVILTLWMLRRNQDRHQVRPTSGPASSSFWNRQTSLWSRRSEPVATPIWTGWNLISPLEVEAGNRTPGEGSPRHSGEEADPFLTRRRSGTIAEEMAQTKTGTDTLVSVPAAAVGAASVRSSPPRTGNIIPRDRINRMMDEDYNEPAADIRIVEPSPQVDHTPLLPPPMLNPDALSGIGFRTSRNISQRSLGSQHRSLGSQKSIGSLEDAELRIARRVRVGELGADAGPSRNNLGLQNLSGRIGRLSWFRRMSLTAAGRATGSPVVEGGASDAYTRSPTRSSHSRHASRSRPSSYVRFQEDPITGRPPRTESGLGYNTSGSRPVSTVSGKSTSAASGNTVYHDAVSTPTSEVPDVPEIPQRFQARGNNGGNGGSSGHLADNSGNGSNGSSGGNGSSSHQSLSQAPGDPSRFTSYGVYASVPNEPPPSYDDSSVPRHRSHTRLPSDIDVLDLPAPPPVTSRIASASSSSFPPPGLMAVPATWRDSSPSNQPSHGSSDDIAFNFEDEPPVAAAGWRSLAGGSGAQGARRTTFGTVGTPMIFNPPVSPTSEQGSLHSMRSHLSPYASRSAIGSAPASTQHTLSGSGSSRPSAHSHAHTGSSSLAHSSSISSFEHRGAMRAAAGDLRSPPLSAVFGGRTRSPTNGSRAGSPVAPLSPNARRAFFPAPSGHDASPTSSRTPLLVNDGTVNSQTNSSVTTALTDPITGTRTHLPSMPWQGGEAESSRWQLPESIDEEWR
ncbi:hypothetical protein EIP91_008830 [Steccherinum ochraceum]|uniref:Uncharacterized protein n=1 Tax=Steccherinum ochraceum TaxID=92696 RepID=A0A4R0RC60_9APHY|nr:hypothetical protein EIP91_008830 [Steccherinum ochraceum]